MTTVHSVAFPHNVEVQPGVGGVVSLAVTNTSTVVDAYQVQVFGLDPAWLTVTPEKLSLFPGETGSVDIRVDLPDDYPASRRMLSVNVVSDDDPTAFNLIDVELVVSPKTVTTIALDPTLVTGGRSATFGIVISNNGNAVAHATGFAVDPEDLAEFQFEPEMVSVAPGREKVIRVTGVGGRQWFGQPRARTFEFGVTTFTPGIVDDNPRVETIGTFIQRPRIGRWLISLLGLLTAAAVFAAVLSRTFDSVVKQTEIADELIDEALREDTAGGAEIPSNPGTVTGKIGSATGSQGLGGVQVELFAAADTTTPVASAVTDEAGAFAMSNLGAGTYKLKLSGAGVAPLWYPAGSVPSEGEDVVVRTGESKPLPDVSVGGLPVSVDGAVEADNPLDLSGVTVKLVADGQLDPATKALVAEIVVSPDGSFSLEGVPSPGVYTLLVEKPGFATELRTVVLEPGKSLDGLSLSLRPGNGIVSGSVSGGDGLPLGGVTVSATDGTRTIETVSLTEGSIGTFRLRNLPTPGQYTVTISRPGYIPETRTVALTDTQQVGSFSAQLVQSTGAITGRATVLGVPEQGLQVTLTGGEEIRSTAVVSQGPAAGTYSFDDLPAPGTYTLTFNGAGTIPQVRVVELDPFIGQRNVGGIDVLMSRQTTTVRGLVRDVDGSLEPRATVTLSNGVDSFTFLTADEPLGEFEFSAVPPGAYTLSASRLGSDLVVVLVNVTPNAAPPILNLQLGTQASLTGTVGGFDSTQRNVIVKLFTPEQFPTGVPLAILPTDATGRYTFSSLGAPITYVVAVFASDTAADPLDSVIVETRPSTAINVPTLTVSLPS